MYIHIYISFLFLLLSYPTNNKNHRTAARGLRVSIG